ncbi:MULTISPECIES: thiosulfate sulfurtransferase GlpE [Chromohalobacter]|jgi:thiosulfate sulfurtransferase|uniref:Thiosulfate sulfurtransferase GlpE n=1 Tax=Chromohalobacter israelensis (strain ATCC BAA-138 / DSM 3043 / CIP 106854 / NCIMB 13768 / 1H11) TaxID=290398 RepID=Q1QZ28_CHRI1|nr:MULTISPECIES: thiosulfate sulfurtransferase GlpE [Chromohalobacter]ABE58280.1 Rhodanese-like protein [Chromohalobacter salexigens DSM 3043]MBZ5875655.1 thiosulfate sulfurtransferase GlpE [Chromohalobacter salexigens]MDF9433273.1 thiosulfate sulfurtransferase GlpE [Chromohalobacter israelensis]NQY45933.1 thiosulfate sulfurtransferase GlpE [Chromohalobacter sp.]PWW40102.1 thiosulfate sulfurtransferase [Chromohalobacter salexigens]
MTQETAFTHLAPSTLVHWLDTACELTLVDIRDPLSFSQGHIPGSQHLDNTSVAGLLERTPRERPMVVVCYHGHSSQQAANWLAGQGFSDVYSLDGGFTDWAARHPDRVES